MGAVISAIQDVYFTIISAVSALSGLNTQFQTLLQRATALPGFPVSGPTSSYWLDDPPHPAVTSSQPALPSEADTVVIGSGITAAAITKTVLDLTANETAPRIVVCEARDVCSGATGRNGGHIKCTPYDSFAFLSGRLGKEKARSLVRFQRRHLDILLELGKEVPEGEVREVQTVDLFLDEKDFEKAKSETRELKEGLPEFEYRLFDAEEARQEFGVNTLISGAIAYTAGALWPYRLVTGVWKRLMDKYPNLVISTQTTVESISRDAASPFPYTVKTTRGLLKARHVVHATNAFAPQLNHFLRGRLTGALAHMSAQRPGEEFPPSHGQRSWSIIYSPGFDYVTQRPDSEDGTPGDLMIGGGFFRSRQQGLDQFGVWDDSRIDALPLMHIRGAMPSVFEPNWGGGSELKKAWTGILGFTGDLMPFVGRLTGSETGPSQWIAAGFNGEGMVWAWLSGTALAIMLLGKEDEELKAVAGRPGGRLADWFPKDELKLDKARLRRANLKNLADQAA